MAAAVPPIPVNNAPPAGSDPSPIKPEDTPRTRQRKEDFLAWALRRHEERKNACESGRHPPALDKDPDSAVLPKSDEHVCHTILGINMDGSPYKGEDAAKKPANAAAPAVDVDNKSGVSYAVLARQDDTTSSAVVTFLASDENFGELSKKEGDLIVQRDKEDDAKLAVGIDIAVKKGVLPAEPDVSPVVKIDVVGKTADAVASELLDHLGGKTEGVVLVIQGLSGTGKGTTTAKIQAALPNCVTWSNGNVFRTLTMLASDYAAEKGVDFGAECLTADLLAEFVKRISFEKFDDGFDVVIDGTTRVSAIQNTKLKEPRISNRVPTVAEQTQGEVVKFAAGAVKTLQEAGKNIILEGRAQTLNHIPTPHRFELVIEDMRLLGQRRAAQRVMAAALKEVTDADDAAAVGAALRRVAAAQGAA